MHTPQEAASLYCPMARMFGIQTAEPHCRGDKCMSWGWQQNHSLRFRSESGS